MLPCCFMFILAVVHFLPLAVCLTSLHPNSASRCLHSFSPFSFLTLLLPPQTQQLVSFFPPFLISQSVSLRRWTQPPGHIFEFGAFLVSPSHADLRSDTRLFLLPSKINSALSGQRSRYPPSPRQHPSPRLSFLLLLSLFLPHSYLKKTKLFFFFLFPLFYFLLKTFPRASFPVLSGSLVACQ